MRLRVLTAGIAAGVAALLALTPAVFDSGRGGQDRSGQARHAARTSAAQPLVVTGYAMPGLPAKVIRRDSASLDIVGVSGLTVKLDGSGVTRSYDGLRALLRTAHRQGLKAELLVSNWSPRTRDFDSDLVARLLSSPAHRRAAAARLARIARTEGWDGITIDLEAMHARDREGLLAFLWLLKQRLPTGLPLSMDIGARSSLGEYRRSGFALGQLKDIVDRIALMTYDQHGPWSGPGPVGARPWQRATIGVLTSRVPASMVDLGIAGYGYAWPASGTARTVSPRRARALASADGTNPTWHPRAAEWSVKLSNGTVIWWSDARSYAARLALARRLGVHGTALWVLGTADPLPGRV